MRELKFRAWNGTIFAYYPIGMNIYKIDRFVLSQATGIKDADNTEVYEGDILKFSYGTPFVHVVAEVVFNMGSFMVLTPGHKPESSPLGELEECVGDFYVIGNIYEDRKLLKDTK